MANLPKKTATEKKGAKKSMKDLYSEKAETKTAATEKKAGNAYKVLVKPLITEKASVMGAQNKYAFEVAVNTNKVEVAKAVKEVYGVRPVNVNIIRVSGKNTRFGKSLGKRKDWKKAIVTLPEGQSIQIYEGV